MVFICCSCVRNQDLNFWFLHPVHWLTSVSPLLDVYWWWSKDDSDEEKFKESSLEIVKTGLRPTKIPQFAFHQVAIHLFTLPEVTCNQPAVEAKVNIVLRSQPACFHLTVRDLGMRFVQYVKFCYKGHERMPVALHQNGHLPYRIVIWTMKLPFPHFPLTHNMLQLGILACKQAPPGVSPRGQGTPESLLPV